MRMLSIIIGVLVAESACGMPTPEQQDVNNNNSANSANSCVVNPDNSASSCVVNPNNVGNIGDGRKENVEGNAMFLPVMNRRFSDGMINFSVWPAQGNQNPGMQNGGYNILRQQPNSRELSLQGGMNGAYANQVCNQQKLLFQSMPTSSAAFSPQEINGNINKNMIFLPVLRGPDNRNQANNTESYSKVSENSIVNAMPQQPCNNQGYFPPSKLNNDIMTPTFTLNDVIRVAEQQIQINRRLNQELFNLRQQNEIFKKEIQNYKTREMYFFPDKIAQLQGQIMKLEEFIINQNQKQLKNQLNQDVKLNRVVFLEQRNIELAAENQRYKNENTRETINQLENKVKELQSQIAEKNANHEAEINDLNEKLQEEKQLNMTLGLSSGSILENNN